MKSRQTKSDLSSFSVSTPVRMNDIGGWTDTWFAGTGAVLNLAIRPGTRVRIRVRENPGRISRRVTVRIRNFGESFAFDPGEPDFSRSAMIQAAVFSLPPPPDLALDISIFSTIPPGSAVGTSASLCVALSAALLKLRGADPSPQAAAFHAHEVETKHLGLQSGIQDQLAAAYGGICKIRMPRYPQSEVKRLRLSPDLRRELDRRICLIYLGQSHQSSEIHEEVIKQLETGSPRLKVLDKLKSLPGQAEQALLQGDLKAYGEVMIRNNEYQRELHPGLISRKADVVIEQAREYGAWGWKVNGAGGQGGSLSILAAEDPNRQKAMLAAISALGQGISPFPVRLTRRGILFRPVKK